MSQWHKELQLAWGIWFILIISSLHHCSHNQNLLVFLCIWGSVCRHDTAGIHNHSELVTKCKQPHIALMKTEFIARCDCWNRIYQKIHEKYVDHTPVKYDGILSCTYGTVNRISSQNFQKWREMRSECQFWLALTFCTFPCIWHLSPYILNHNWWESPYT